MTLKYWLSVLVKGYEIFFRESDTAQANDFCIKTKEDPWV